MTRFLLQMMEDVVEVVAVLPMIVVEKDAAVLLNLRRVVYVVDEPIDELRMLLVALLQYYKIQYYHV